MITRPLPLLVFLVPLLLPLNGCKSIARGVTEGILARADETSAPGICEIQGGAFPGLQQALRDHRDDPEQVVKVLMVHGIGEHFPGYSGHLRANLVHLLDLPRTAPVVKEIRLAVPDWVPASRQSDPRGVLRISRHRGADGERELLFYELVWSPIATAEREAVAMHSDWGLTYHSAMVNGAMQTFFNRTVPDLLIYRGDGRRKILSTFTQSLCWMINSDWAGLPQESDALCEVDPREAARQITGDSYLFITHSLGSRIVTDGLIRVAGRRAQPAPAGQRPLMEALQRQSITLFMLANQLRLLQVGHQPPTVANQRAQYCRPSGTHFQQRLLDRLRIVAFNDPNDILSYPVPSTFVSEYLDSRLCPEVVNVALNVAPVHNIASIDFANPAEAHTDYNNDPRVVGLIAGGLGTGETPPVVRRQCRWIRLVED